MKRQRHIIVLLLSVVFLAGCISFTIGKKPIVTLEDVKQLKPADLADFTISLYNKRADWYKAQMKNVTTLSKEAKKGLVDEYSFLTKSWPIIDLYDRTVSGGQVDADLQIQIYEFIARYLGGN